MARKYEKVQEMLPVVRQLAEAGDTQQQIADKLGLNNAKVVRNLLWREKKKDVQGVPSGVVAGFSLAYRKEVKASVKYKVIYRHKEKYSISEM